MSLGIFHDSGGMIETHRPVVEQGCSEGGEITDLQKCTGIGDESKAGGMGFRETIQGEGTYKFNKLFLGLRCNLVDSHTGAEFRFNLKHALAGALAAKGAAQFFSLAAAKVRGNHGQL